MCLASLPPPFDRTYLRRAEDRARRTTADTPFLQEGKTWLCDTIRQRQRANSEQYHFYTHIQKYTMESNIFHLIQSHCLDLFINISIVWKSCPKMIEQTKNWAVLPPFLQFPNQDQSSSVRHAWKELHDLNQAIQKFWFKRQKGTNKHHPKTPTNYWVPDNRLDSHITHNCNSSCSTCWVKAFCWGLLLKNHHGEFQHTFLSTAWYFVFL